MPRYQYSPLPEGCIRLLQLVSSRDERAPIQCRVSGYPFSPSSGDGRKGTHLYEALSYVWGLGRKPHHVNTDRGDIYVTTNLFMTLQRLRDCFLDRIVWIDAICIDQENTKERKSKVALRPESMPTRAESLFGLRRPWLLVIIRHPEISSLMAVQRSKFHIRLRTTSVVSSLRARRISRRSSLCFNGRGLSASG